MNKSNPKVSVLMCVYNGKTYLREALDSIVGQTFKDFEFIIVDDGSTDNSWEILTEYSKQDSRIVLINNEENLGLEKSLNKGIAATKGEYIARQDADDISLPNRLQLQVDFLDAHPEVGALGSSVEFIDSQGSILQLLKVPTDHETIQARLLIRNCLLHSSMTMRSSLIQKLDGYNEDMLYAEDYDLWWRISLHSRLATLPEILLQYRWDNPSSVSKLKYLQQLKCAQEISFKAIQESLLSKAINFDRQAYERFWWAYLELLDPKAYQKYWLIDRTQQGLLKWQDIRKLKPLWDLLQDHPAGAKVWGSKFYELAILFLRSQRTLLGLHLLWITWRQLQMPISWRRVFKILIKPYITTFLNPIRRIWYRGMDKCKALLLN